MEIIKILGFEGYSPEQKLLSAILFRSIKDLTDPSGIVRFEATGWILSKSKQPFSFLWICEHLSLDSKTFLDKEWSVLLSISRDLYGI